MDERGQEEESGKEPVVAKVKVEESPSATVHCLMMGGQSDEDAEVGSAAAERLVDAI